MRAPLPTPGRIREFLDAHRADLRSRTYATSAYNPPTAVPETIPVTTRDGARLRVHAYGPADRPVLVLVHGWSCAIEYWNAQINAFAGDYRVIAYDQRGHGESELGSSHLDCDLLADDLDAVLTAALRPGQRAVLAGHSLGGMTLQAWARRYPDRVTERAHAVLLTNTAPDGLIAATTVVPFVNSELPLLHRRIPLPHFIGRAALGTPLVFPPIAPVRWIFANTVMSRECDAETVRYGMNIVRSCPARVRARFGLLLADMDLGDAARNLVVPTTILAGSLDDMTPPSHSERIVEILRETGSLARYHVLRTGHLGNVEAYREFNAELARVLESVDHPTQVAEIAG
ncbi:alpha/beta fold hydrolase [Nocardia arthritidis]|uniref:Alpha/beta fold hydrolase n=1 Tax=Nocardia arthritidis TaxID=228602 RepID=A0A6G9YSN3_9NOCA|nr:alpha/beta hydrolase [Nocardia arthritidis]QIS16117.1 alpha/beta fold hydrolase [Nocardia arthritidis]